MKAQRFGVETLIFEKERSWEWLIEQLKLRNIEMIFLAGFMKILPAMLVKSWPGMIFNIHPSLLPLFAGKNGIDDAILNQGPYGVSLHIVDENMDTGTLLLQKKFKPSSDIYLDYAKAEQALLRDFAQRWC